MSDGRSAGGHDGTRDTGRALAMIAVVPEVAAPPSRLAALLQLARQGWLLNAALILLVLGGLLWLVLGRVELAEFSGSRTDVIEVGRWPETRVSAIADGFHRIELRIRPVGGERGVAVRLRDADQPDHDIATWFAPPPTGESSLFFDFEPIRYSAGRTYLILVEPLPGPGGPPLLMVTPAGVPLRALGVEREVGFELRRYYQTSPAIWLSVMLSRVMDRGTGPLVLIAMTLFVGVLLVIARSIASQYGTARPMAFAFAGFAILAGYIQSSSASGIWEAAAGSPPARNGTIISDLGRRLDDADTVVVPATARQGERPILKAAYARIDNEWGPVIDAHPPLSFAMPVDLPASARLRYAIALRPEAWSSERGDGVEFTVSLQSGEKETVLMSDWVDPKSDPGDRRWHYRDVDLTPWAGQRVTLQFQTSAGPSFDYDFAIWGRPIVLVR